MPSFFIDLSAAEYRRFMADDSVWTDPITKKEYVLDDEEMSFSSQASQPFVPLEVGDIEEQLSMTENDANESAKIRIVGGDVYNDAFDVVGGLIDLLYPWLERDRAFQETLVLQKVTAQVQSSSNAADIQNNRPRL